MDNSARLLPLHDRNRAKPCQGHARGLLREESVRMGAPGFPSQGTDLEGRRWIRGHPCRRTGNSEREADGLPHPRTQEVESKKDTIEGTFSILHFILRVFQRHCTKSPIWCGPFFTPPAASPSGHSMPTDQPISHPPAASGQPAPTTTDGSPRTSLRSPSILHPSLVPPTDGADACPGYGRECHRRDIDWLGMP